MVRQFSYKHRLKSVGFSNSSQFAFVVFLVFFFSNCFSQNTQKENYSYSLQTYFVEKGIKSNMNMPSNRLISFNGFLLEFNIAINSEEEIIPEQPSIIKYQYDTASVYVLDKQQRKFYEFSSFTDTGKLIRSGRFSEKPFGIRLVDTAQKAKPNSMIKEMKDTSLFGLPLKYVTETIKNIRNTDSCINYVFLYKNNHFTSLYTLMTGDMADKDYHMIGFSALFKEQEQIAESTLENFRTLTNQEEQICAALIRKMPLSAIKDVVPKK